MDIARELYCGYLGFEVVFEHRFAPELPLYMRISRGAIQLDLSQHHGDGTPGSVVWIAIEGLAELHREVTDRSSAPIRPGIEHSAPGGPTMAVVDPFQNVLRFCEPGDK